MSDEQENLEWYQGDLEELKKRLQDSRDEERERPVNIKHVDDEGAAGQKVVRWEAEKEGATRFTTDITCNIQFRWNWKRRNHNQRHNSIFLNVLILLWSMCEAVPITIGLRSYKMTETAMFPVERDLDDRLPAC